MSARWVPPRLLPARPRLKDLKYKLLGIPPPDRPQQYVPLETWQDTDTLQYLKQTRVLAQSAIALLARATDLTARSTARPPIRASLRHAAAADALLKPGTNFDHALAQLTSYDFGAKYTERISLFLAYRLRPGNTLPLSTDSYNRAIGYFLAVRDVHMARLLFHQMQQRRVRPDTTTVNLFLASQAQRIAANPYPLEQLGHPFFMTISLLRRMNGLHIGADAETWNLVLQCMPFGFGKSFLVEEMDRRRIPLNAESQRVCFETILAEQDSGRRDGVSTRIYDTVLSSLDVKNPVLTRLIIDRMLAQKQPDNANVKKALSFLTTVTPPDQTTEMLNVFLKRFAERKHLDWLFGILGYFKETAWNAETWEHFIHAASRTFYHRAERYTVIGTVLKQAEREMIPLTSRARVFSRRALRVAARHGQQCSDLGPAGWESLKANLSWSVGTMQPQNAAFLHHIGFGDPKEHDHELVMDARPADLDVSRFEAVPGTNTDSRLTTLVAALRQSVGERPHPEDRELIDL